VALAAAAAAVPCAVAAAGPPAARAVTVENGSTVNAPDVDHWLDVAERYWGAEPLCPFGLLLSLSDALGAGVIAHAELPGCAIHYAQDWYPRAPGRSWAGWAQELCIITVHEYGHLLGYQHVSDPNDIMYPTPTFVPPGCDWTVQPYRPPDVGPPAVHLTAPVPGPQIARDSSFRLGYTCSDDVDATGAPASGVASCTGPTDMDTSRLGPHRYAVTATDRAGHRTTVPFVYTVVTHVTKAASSSPTAAPTVRTGSWVAFALARHGSHPAVTGRARTGPGGGGQVQTTIELKSRSAARRAVRVCVAAVTTRRCRTVTLARGAGRTSLSVPYARTVRLTASATGQRTVQRSLAVVRQ
jgi:hypothetical protein